MFKYPTGHMVVSGRGPYLGCLFFPRCSLFSGLADVGQAVAHSSAEHIHACGVCNEIHAGAFVKAHGFPCRERILIRREKLEVPLVRGLLVFDAILHVIRRVFVAGVLHAVGDDDAKDVLGTLRLFLVCELVANGVDGDANGVVEGCAAGAVVLRHEVVAELCEISGFDRPLDLIVELKEVEDGFTGFFALFFQELVERALDVVLNRAHGTGCIEDDDEVGVVVFHVQFSFVWFCVW